MDPKALREMLEAVKRGETDVDDALVTLRDLPFRSLGFATIDHHRALRLGHPEVIFGAGKTAEQLLAIVREIAAHGQNVLATRVTPEIGAWVMTQLPALRYDNISRTLVLEQQQIELRGRGEICIVSAGTSDQPVAEEAAVTARALGNAVPHLHWHIVARFEWDSHFPAPVWAPAQREAPPDRLAAVEQLRPALEKELAGKLANGSGICTGS